MRNIHSFVARIRGEWDPDLLVAYRIVPEAVFRENNRIQRVSFLTMTNPDEISVLIDAGFRYS